MANLTLQNDQIFKSQLFNETIWREIIPPRYDCYWLHVVPWNEVKKFVWIEVNAMTKPMMICEDFPPYGGKSTTGGMEN